MKLTRRDALKIAAAAVPSLAAAKAPAPYPPIVTSGGIRLYPNGQLVSSPAGWVPWWTPEPIYGWDLPHDNVPSAVSLGATRVPDGSTTIVDLRNTPLYGPFTRAYFQFSTPPLAGAQTLNGVVSAVIHATQANRRINAVLAVQVVVHRPDTTVRGVALPVTLDSYPFTEGDPPRSRAAQNWPLTSVACEDGDIIAINVGLYANNQTRSLGQGVGFALYANQPADVSRLNDPQLANTWVEFSAPLTFTQ
jgi:hypothetical protein